MARPGRKRMRAASTSTVATIDEQTITFLKEEQVIRPPLAGTATDDLPCFELTEAAVYDRHGRMANLLHVDLEGPLLVRGLLNIEPDQSNCLVRGMTRSRSLWFEISRSYSYSYALKPGAGMPIVWAAGKSAHFEISPSERYAPIANVMFQTVVMYYQINDIYEAEVEAMAQHKSKAKKRRPRLQDVDLPIEEILYRYAAAVGDGSTLEEVIDRCREQAAFLLTRFPKETKFHTWLAGQAPDVAERLRKLDNKPAPTTELPFAEPQLPPVTKASSSRQESSPAESVGKRRGTQRLVVPRSTRSSSRVPADVVDHSNDEQRSSRSRSERNSSRATPKLGMVKGPGTADIDMQDFAPKPFVLPDRAKNGVSPSEIHPALAAVIEVLDTERAKLLEAWNRGVKQKKHPDTLLQSQWLTKIYMAMSIGAYAAKTEVLQYHAEGLAKHLSGDWHNSQLYEWAKRNADIKPKYEHISEEHILRIRRRQRNPNATPRGEKEARAGATAGKTSVEPVGKRPRGRPSGKAAGLRPSLGGGKRLRDVYEDEDSMGLDSEQGHPVRKAARTSQYPANGHDEDDELSDSSSSDEESPDEKGEEPLTRVVLRADPLPSMEPKGPNQTWTCEQPDCNYLVRGADDEDAKELIRNHFEEHEKEASDEAEERALNKINLAMQESQGHMPINHLLEKIRKAKAKSGQEELQGRVVSQPISNASFLV